MRGKVTFVFIVIIAFLAYVLGAKAGKARYKEISSAVNSFWNDPQVKKARVRAVKGAKRATADATKAAEKAAKKAGKKAQKHFS
ncbi:hypothetical protein [Subtercola lobariae]|uniref:YtxH domain-containing protein n=1 Tax=Subtercola lobariae TaxID=1588641 RepID=A0A917BD21_9MICO|nr:hypothetical protein [Subtercola lobariae]GGF37604.1 hypothetical protein GCM10011399_33180 [Subtercola lobariae]